MTLDQYQQHQQIKRDWDIQQLAIESAAYTLAIDRFGRLKSGKKFLFETKQSFVEVWQTDKHGMVELYLGSLSIHEVLKQVTAEEHYLIA